MIIILNYLQKNERMNKIFEKSENSILKNQPEISQNQLINSGKIPNPERSENIIRKLMHSVWVAFIMIIYIYITSTFLFILLCVYVSVFMFSFSRRFVCVIINFGWMYVIFQSFTWHVHVFMWMYVIFNEFIYVSGWFLGFIHHVLKYLNFFICFFMYFIIDL